MMLLDRETTVAALTLLSDKLGERDCRAELLLAGGAVMCVVHEARPATKDVDDWFSDPVVMRSAARSVAEEQWRA